MLDPPDVAVLPTVIWVHLLAQVILAVIPRRPTLAPLNLVLASSRHYYCTLPALQLRCWLALSQFRVRELACTSSPTPSLGGVVVGQSVIALGTIPSVMHRRLRAGMLMH